MSAAANLRNEHALHSEERVIRRRDTAVGTAVVHADLPQLHDLRSPSLTIPGTSATADVVRLQELPIAVLPLATQLAGTGKGMSTTVAGSVPPPGEASFHLSVRRAVAFTCSSPV